jgi:hypothetical protein
MPPVAPLRPAFVLFGDSITQRGGAVGGWATRLAERYTRRADVVNRGYSGYNTAWATHLLPLVFPQARSALVARGRRAALTRAFCAFLRVSARRAARRRRWSPWSLAPTTRRCRIAWLGGSTFRWRLTRQTCAASRRT